MVDLGFPGDSVVKKKKKKTCLLMQETLVWFLGREGPLEKERATHSGILAWKTPWAEELGRLQSSGSQRVRQN